MELSSATQRESVLTVGFQASSVYFSMFRIQRVAINLMLDFVLSERGNESITSPRLGNNPQ